MYQAKYLEYSFEFLPLSSVTIRFFAIETLRFLTQSFACDHEWFLAARVS